MVFVSGKTVPTTFIKPVSLSFEDKRPFTILSAQVKCSSSSRKSNVIHNFGRGATNYLK